MFLNETFAYERLAVHVYCDGERGHSNPGAASAAPGVR